MLKLKKATLSSIEKKMAGAICPPLLYHYFAAHPWMHYADVVVRTFLCEGYGKGIDWRKPWRYKILGPHPP